jgi:hypothetical protein
VKEQFLRPFPRTTTDGVAVSHSITFVDAPHVLIIMFYNFWLQGVSTLITEIFCWWIMHVCQHVEVTFVLPSEDRVTVVALDGMKLDVGTVYLPTSRLGVWRWANNPTVKNVLLR